MYNYNDRCGDAGQSGRQLTGK